MLEGRPHPSFENRRQSPTLSYGTSGFKPINHRLCSCVGRAAVGAAYSRVDFADRQRSPTLQSLHNGPFLFADLRPCHASTLVSPKSIIPRVSEPRGQSNDSIEALSKVSKGSMGPFREK